MTTILEFRVSCRFFGNLFVDDITRFPEIPKLDVARRR